MTPGLERWRRATDGPLLVVAIGSLPLLLLEVARADLPLSDRRFLDIMNVLVLVAFAVDYIVELRLASNRRAFARFEWTSIVIVVTQALAIMPGLSAFGALRVLRATPALRGALVVLRLLAVGGSVAREGRATLRRRAATFALTLAGFVWLTSAVAFTLAEQVGDGNDRADSFFDALWWSSATITTVGYGDVYPVTTAGRTVGMITMVVGVATFAVVTAKIAEFLVKSDQEEAITETTT
jgi:voltage-gated potassium channel